MMVVPESFDMSFHQNLVTCSSKIDWNIEQFRDAEGQSTRRCEGAR